MDGTTHISWVVSLSTIEQNQNVNMTPLSPDGAIAFQSISMNKGYDGVYATVHFACDSPPAMLDYLNSITAVSRYWFDDTTVFPEMDLCDIAACFIKIENVKARGVVNVGLGAFAVMSPFLNMCDAAMARSGWFPTYGSPVNLHATRTRTCPWTIPLYM